MVLDLRKQKILSAIVEKYTYTGEPVGSKTVCDMLNFSISSATVRNEMAELSNLGYILKTHTSSGRIPSHKGYRFYVDYLIKKSFLSVEEKNYIDGILYLSSSSPEVLINGASKLLADITNYISVFTTPFGNDSKIRDIKFVQIGRRNAMIILMTTTGIVKNRLFRCEYDINLEILDLFSKLLNEKFVGRLLNTVSPNSFDSICSIQSDISMLLFPVINSIMEAVTDAKNVEVITNGYKNLFEFSDVLLDDSLQIMDFLENKQKVLNLFLFNDHVKTNTIIGPENHYKELNKFSVVMTKYMVNGKSGALGIIGPVRMDYSLIIAKLEYISYSVELILKKILEPN